MRIHPFALGLMLALLTLIYAHTLQPNPVATEPATRAPEEMVTEVLTTYKLTAEEPTTVEEPETVQLDPEEVELIGRTIWGEAGGVESDAERAAVAWCILNRVDVSGKTIKEVVTAPNQFQGYRPNGECPQEHLDLAADVLTRWKAEKNGAENVGRVLPDNYLYFIGDGSRNYFSIKWQALDFWDWSLENPYID